MWCPQRFFFMITTSVIYCILHGIAYQMRWEEMPEGCSIDSITVNISDHMTDQQLLSVLFLWKCQQYTWIFLYVLWNIHNQLQSHHTYILNALPGETTAWDNMIWNSEPKYLYLWEDQDIPVLHTALIANLYMNTVAYPVLFQNTIFSIWQ